MWLIPIDKHETIHSPSIIYGFRSLVEAPQRSHPFRAPRRIRGTGGSPPATSWASWNDGNPPGMPGKWMVMMMEHDINL